MRNKVVAEVTSEQGFYIGDICYVLGEPLYHGVWGEQYNFQHGTFSDPKTGLSVAVAGTAYGDGCYLGSDGTKFPVDAGVIGVVPLELVQYKNSLDCGKVVKCPGMARLEAEDGKFEISLPDSTILTINTDYGPHDPRCDEDDEEAWDEDE